MADDCGGAAAGIGPASSRGGWAAAAVLCLGVWLHAADSLLAATVMPSAVREIGGLQYIYWTVALYQLGSIAAGAATGLLAIRLGLRAGMVIAAAIYGSAAWPARWRRTWPSCSSAVRCRGWVAAG